MANDELSIVFIFIGILFIVAAVVVAALPQWGGEVLEFLSDYFTRMILAIILVIIGVILIVIGILL